ncbi:HIT family protein [Fimbriimonas ginsengisoli]|uniref:HIT domain-containing protein n=1 Tax=Fimbriimonas ginsengisoli Gsoil 348 TaxID=661478 RepID=A0A068NNJ2_FIMGI|nr:hypothetical protein [Fimbriimonas ginsengisoli]AIE84972.1 hypothetical protein OP10G_1604 [Fimbriimonas ginsengisoli Gsoil 348]
MPNLTPAERLAALEAGENPLEIARMKSGYAVMGDSQFLPGYCLLLAFPLVEKLNDLQGEHRTAFLDDMAKLGDAVLASTDAVRINYSIYGNLDPFLHAHIFPRYATEDPAYATIPPMSIPADVRGSVPYDPSVHDALRRVIASHLQPYEPV